MNTEDSLLPLARNAVQIAKSVNDQPSETKKECMRELVRKRRSGWLPDGCYRLGDVALNNGYWEEDEYVVPWSKSACKYGAKVMLMAQDWDSYRNLSAPLTEKHRRIKLVGRNEALLTNKRLDKLLKEYLHLDFQDTFATDLFPFVKMGDMRGALNWADFLRCARDFALPQIDIIKPLMVVCLGRSTTFRAIAKILTGNLVVGSGDNPLGALLYHGTEIYGVTHPGGRGNGWLDRIKVEWTYLDVRLKELKSRSENAHA